MSTATAVRGARIPTSDLYGEQPGRTIRPPRKVYFKCPERCCGFEHAQWALVAQHLFHHHGYSQELIDLEECEQRKTRRNKSWLKKRLANVVVAAPLVDEDGNELDEENQENETVEMKPSPIVLEAMLKLVPRGNGVKEMCTCPLPECGEAVPNRVELVKHARVKHMHHHTASGNFEVRAELFENEDDFRDWKSRLEEEFGMYYACEATGKAGECKNFFYVCHRSGRVVRRMRQMRERRAAAREARADELDLPLSPPKRRLKVVKAQEYCTAFMRVRRDQVGRFHVAYSTSHIGHDQDPALLPLTPAMKKIIYDRVVAEHGTSSMSLIANRIRESFPDVTSRLHYVVMTDVIEVIRMERKRLARVGGEEAENALDIFKTTSKKGRRKMGQELLMSGERHKPPRPGGGGMGGTPRGGGGRRMVVYKGEEMDDDEGMDSKAHLLPLRGRPMDVKLNDDDDDVDEEEDDEMGEEEVVDMDRHHHGYYVDDGQDEHAAFEVGDEDASMMDDAAQEHDEEELPLMPSTSRAGEPQPRLMEDAVTNKHKMDEHVDNICEALVRSGDAVALQAYLDAIRTVSTRYEHLLRR